MKLKYFFGLLLSILFMTGCSEDAIVGSLEEISVDQTFVSLPTGDGKVVVTIKASQAWEFMPHYYKNAVYTKNDHLDEMTVLPNWLTASQVSGEAGETKVEFSAKSCEYGREAEVMIRCGEKTQFINVRQGSMDASKATCAEVIAGADGKTYIASGTVTSIANTTYGNWYLNDGTGEVYIYGTLDADGATKNFTSLGIEVGDVVTVQGPKTTYGTTVELVDVTVLKIEKALLKVTEEPKSVAKEGGEATFKIAYKGNGIFLNIPEDCPWVNLKSMDYVAGVPTKLEKAPADTAIVTLTVAANTGAARAATVTVSSKKEKNSTDAKIIVSQEGAIQDVNCAQFNAQEDGEAQYKVRGIITSITNTTYGNLYINDGTGEVYVYGMLDAEGNTKNFLSLGLKVGDEVVLQSVKTSHNNSPQMKNATLVSVVPHEVKTVAELKALPDDKDTYFLVTGTVCHAEEEGTKFDLQTYGNFGLQDETGIIYVYGVADALNGKTKNFAATGVKEGDKITILAYKTSYKETIELVGQFIKKESAE